MHEEPWAFTVIQDAAVLKRISDRAKLLLVDDALRGGRHLKPGDIDRFTNPDFSIFYDAGTLICIYCLPVSAYAKGDCWLAAENLMIAACALGLGTCVIGLGVAAMNDAQIKAELKVPPEMTAVVPIIVGFPRGEPQPSQRKDPQILSWR
jgi:nitroreductase